MAKMFGPDEANWSLDEKIQAAFEDMYDKFKDAWNGTSWWEPEKRNEFLIRSLEELKEHIDELIDIVKKDS